MKCHLKYCLSLVLFLCIGQAHAQQTAQYSQYLDNYYLVNPAATNIQNNLQLHMGFRHYWTDFEGSPKTIYLSAYAPLTKPGEDQHMRSAMRLTDRLDTSDLSARGSAKSNHIAGLILSQDDIGLFSKTTAHLTYSFHLPLTESLSVSVSPKLGWVHLGLNEDLRVLEENDQPFLEFMNNHQQRGMFDLGFGLWLYSDKLFFGYSLEQLVKNTAFSSEQVNGVEFEPHHYVMAGYRFRVSPRLKLVPNLLVRYVEANLTSTDYSLRAEYGSRLWASFSFRQQNAMVALVGMSISNQLSFSYSFDHSNDIALQNRINAHEISLRINVLPNLHK